MLPRPFVFHEPAGDETAISSSETTPNRTGLSSLTGLRSSVSSASRLNSTQLLSTQGARGAGGVPLEGGGSTAEIPWDEVASSIIADPKEKAAALIMLNRSPLHGTAVPCTITIHNDNVLEITLATHRTGVFPLDPTSATYPGDTLDRQQRRRVVIPLSTVSSIGCDLPQPSTTSPPMDKEGSSMTTSWTDTTGGMFHSIGSSDDASVPFRYGYEIAGSPMRALRITLHIQHDPTQKAAEWFGSLRSASSAASSHQLRPRTVVLYATSLADANTWRAYLRKVCQGNLTEALGRSTWKKLGDGNNGDTALATNNSESLIDGVLSRARGVILATSTSQRQQPSDTSSQANDNLVAASDKEPLLLLEPSSTPSTDFLRWHAKRHLTHLASSQGDVDRIEPSRQRMMVRLKDCTGYGVWCPYGHKWLSEVQSSIRLEAFERVAASTMPIMEEVEEDTIISDVAPWIVLERNSSNALHENILHSQSMKRDLMWRLSSLRHRVSSDHVEKGRLSGQDDMTTSSELSWLDARARFMSPANFQRFTAQKYIDVEGALGDVIDSIADRLSAATGIEF
ncbi:Hypothetical protein, putative [Bodo saltans]|uniref:Uncharacterized protein n=1 Tax=Bodo saltans TaxID=75058 RepID=A0A0S4J9F9_BODSA|nr:Hypothetical protein, putative [Bodo saltans]|eukprot:CUG87110.1 Hypothetical protein, putative [Bodo saltans]